MNAANLFKRTFINIYSMVLIQSATQFKDMIENGQISIMRKPQKNEGYNYFLSPNLGFKLYGAKVVFADPNYLVLEFDKVKNGAFMSLLQFIDTKIKDYLKRSYVVESEVFHDLIKQTDTTYTIRCHLPHLGKKYFVECESDGNKVPFHLPRRSALIDNGYVEIRNIWETNNRLGYNIELKSVKI
jgi:hypothetical protein